MIDSCDSDKLFNILIDMSMVEYITNKIDPKNITDFRILTL